MDNRLSKPEKKPQASKETREKSFTEQNQKQKAARESTSSTKDLKIKPGDLRAPQSGDRNLEVRQALSQRSGDHGVSNPSGRSFKVVQHWRPKPADQGVSNPSEKPFNAGKEVPSLVGGGLGKWIKKATKGYGGVQLTNNSPGDLIYKSHHIGNRPRKQQSSEEQSTEHWSRPVKQSASTSNDTTTAASKPLQDKDKIPPLQGGGIRRNTRINNTGDGKVYYKSSRIGRYDDSSEQYNGSRSSQRE